jgi:hypothetical protein
MHDIHLTWRYSLYDSGVNGWRSLIRMAHRYQSFANPHGRHQMGTTARRSIRLKRCVQTRALQSAKVCSNSLYHPWPERLASCSAFVTVVDSTLVTQLSLTVAQTPPHTARLAQVHCALSLLNMGFVSKITALAFVATVSVAAAGLGLDVIDTKLSKKLTQTETNGTSCLLLTNCSVR